MKKLVLLITGLCLVVLSACSQRNQKNDEQEKKDTTAKKAAARTSDVYRTLTNIEQKDARDMFDKFEHDGYVNFKTRVTWFHIDSAVIKAMLRMLYKEKNAEGNRPDSIDGFRIYIIHDPKLPSEPTITIVSTRDSTKWHKAGDPSSVHKDYYLHDGNDPFFSLTNYTVVRGHDDDAGGAALYKHYTGADPGCYPTINDIERSVAEDMVARFGKGDKFNTRSAWYPLRMYENFEDIHFSGGVRFYLGNKDLYEGKKDRNTFIMVSTDKGSGNHYIDNYSCLRFHFAPLPPPLDNGELCPNHCN